MNIQVFYIKLIWEYSGFLYELYMEIFRSLTQGYNMNIQVFCMRLVWEYSSLLYEATMGIFRFFILGSNVNINRSLIFRSYI